MKRELRKRTDYSLKGLLHELPIQLDGVPLATIRRYARLSWRWMDAYKRGATGRLAKFAVRKFKSHRSLPPGWMDEVRQDYECTYGSKVEDEVLSAAMIAAGSHEEGDGEDEAATGPEE